jgi:hypothetical protein
MAFGHGKDAVFKLDNAGASLTDISAYIRSVRYNPTAAADETTTMGKASKTFIAGLKDATISVEGFWDPTVDAIFNSALGSSTTKTFEHGPEGGTSGDIRYTGECICTSYNIDPAVDGVVPFSAELQVTGDVTRNTY